MSSKSATRISASTPIAWLDSGITAAPPKVAFRVVSRVIRARLSRRRLSARTLSARCGVTCAVAGRAVVDHHLQTADRFSTGTQVGAVSRGDGDYRFQIRPGTYELRARLIGYEVRRDTVRVEFPGMVRLPLTVWVVEPPFDSTMILGSIAACWVKPSVNPGSSG